MSSVASLNITSSQAPKGGVNPVVNNLTVNGTATIANLSIADLTVTSSITLPSLFPTTSSTITGYGLVITLGVSSSGATITMPTTASGVFFKFLIAGGITSAITIKFPASSLLGTIANSTAISTAKTNLIVGTTAVAGDTIEVGGNASNYYVSVNTSVGTAYTTS